MCKKIALIMAGGYGDRMDCDIPKQFLPLHDTPLIVHTLLKFERCALIDVIVVACVGGWEDYLKELALKYGISKLAAVVTGGNTSQESILNGIGYLLDNNYGEDDIVVVHESVRPFVTEDIIRDNINMCAGKGNAVTAIRGNESCLYSMDGVSSGKVLLREHMYMVQTPQTFRLGGISGAIDRAIGQGKVFQSLFIMMSELGETPLNMVCGDRFNIKLTYPEDLKIFEMLFSLDLNIE